MMNEVRKRGEEGTEKEQKFVRLLLFGSVFEMYIDMNLVF